MKIKGTAFGSITIDGENYRHDVIVRLSGKVRKRRKKLSSGFYGTSHLVSAEEAAFIYEKGCRLLVVGTGQGGNLRLSTEAAAFFEERDCLVVAVPTPEAIRIFNDASGEKIGLFHVTC